MIETETAEPVVPALAPAYAPSTTVEDFILATAAGPYTEMRLLILEGSRGEGKGQPADALVFTPTGQVKIGDLRIGNQIYTGDGSVTTVTGVYDRGVMPVWRMRFSDGTTLIVSDDHLWAVETGWDRNGRQNRYRGSRVRGALASRPARHIRRPRTSWKVATTQEIRERLESGAWTRGGRWSIPLVGPVQFQPQVVPLDPYLLGVLLGDGGMTNRDSVRITTADPEILVAVQNVAPTGTSIRHISTHNYQVAGNGKVGGNPVMNALRALGLMGHGAATKFVPDIYLWNEPAIRLAVLQGLLDTDGTILKHSNSVSYSTTSERLAEGVEFLVRSLGGLTKRRMRQTHYTYKGERKAGRPSYHVAVSLPNGTAPFRLARKMSRVADRGQRNMGRRYILAVEPAGETKVVCIRVAHPSGLYVADDFIVTHNTTGAIWAYQALAERILADGRGHSLPIKVGLVRDTFQNIQRTTIDAFRQAQAKGLDITFADQNREALISIDGRVMVHVFFFGLDNARDADKLQGFQCGILHLEEVAPAASMSAGVPAEALGLGNTSVRQEGIPPRILVTMNPPDEDHWIVTIEKHLAETGLADVVVKRFVINPGEKSEHFRMMAQEAETAGEYERWIEAATAFDAYRDRSRAFLEAIGRGDLVTRLVGGQRGMVQEGEVVVKSYSRALHLARQPLQIYQHMPIIRGWDAGLTPSTVWVQPTPRGNLNILGSRITVGGGMEAHILNQVIPFERKYGLTTGHGTTGRGFGRGAKTGFTFRDIGDPACLSGNPTKGEQTVAWLIEDMLNTHFEPGPVEWSARREALNSAFSRKGEGDRMFIMLDPDETRSSDQSANLEVSLNGRFHYPKHPVTGRILGTIEAAKRTSGIYAQEVDSLAYILAVMFPAQEWLRRRIREAAPATRQTGYQPKTYLGH